MLGIIIPVYNEGENIKTCLDLIEQEVKTPHKIKLVYDFDDDSTLAAARGYNVEFIKNKGHGALEAIKTGLEISKEEFLVVTMADLSDPAYVIDKLAETAQNKEADVVCASRYMKGGSQKGGPLVKRVLSRLAGLSLYYLADIKTHDATNSFKLYRKSFLKTVKIESKGGFEIGLELVVKAKIGGFKIEEIPTSWRDRSCGKSNFKLLKWLPCYLKWYFMGIFNR